MSDPRIETYLGLRIDPLAVKREDINAVDIAHGLSMACRFSRFCARFFSVAEHSVNCLRYARAVYGVRGDEALAVLLHDAEEYALGDIAAPVKMGEALKPIVFSQAVTQRLVAEAFGLPNPLPADIGVTVHATDTAMRWLEADLLMSSGGSWWEGYPGPIDVEAERGKWISSTVIWPPDAEETFMNELRDLMDELGRKMP